MEESEAIKEQAQYLTFGVDGDEYAIGILQVREIIGIRALKQRELFDDTVVLIGGEFGRTPKINGGAGRDHWPHGFSVALAGGPFRRGHVHGATDPEGGKDVKDPLTIADIHATVMHALAINPAKIMSTPVGRPMELSKGRIARELLTM